DIATMQDGLGAGATNAVNIGQSDFCFFPCRQINTNKTCHDSFSSLTLPLLMLGVAGTNDPNHTLTVDHLALVTNLFNASSDLHLNLNNFTIRPRVRSPGANWT